MLPENVPLLLESFVRTFDNERPRVIEFRKASNQPAAQQITDPRLSKQVTGSWLNWDSGAIIRIGKNLTAYLEDRTRFVWAKCREIITSTAVQPYPELATDLRKLISDYHSPAQQASEQYIEDLRRTHNIPSGYTVETKRAFGNVLAKIHADIDLFCEMYRVGKAEPTANHVYNIGEVHGLVGNITNSQVAIGVSPMGPPSGVALEVTATLEMEHTDTLHGLLTIKALNTGNKVAKIRRVAVLVAPERMTVGDRTFIPDSSEFIIGQKQAVVQIEGDDGMHEWQQVLKFKPNFEVQEREGERYGKGYVELTSGKKIDFQFLLLPDSAWAR